MKNNTFYIVIFQFVARREGVIGDVKGDSGDVEKGPAGRIFGIDNTVFGKQKNKQNI